MEHGNEAASRKTNSNHGYYCCVPLCQNRSWRDSSWSFHSFPSSSRADVRRLWIHAIRREEGKHFKITSNTRVCSAHFKDEDFRISPYAGTAQSSSCRAKRCLLPTAVPSVFSWAKPEAQKRRVPRDRQSLPSPKLKKPKQGEEEEIRESSDLPGTSVTTDSLEAARSCASIEHDYAGLLPGGIPLPPGVLEHIRCLEKEVADLKKENKSLRKRTISLESLKENDEDFCACTGLPNYDVFEGLCEYLRPKARRLQRWRGKATIEKMCRTAQRKRGTAWRSFQRSTRTVEEELFAVLFRLRTGTSVRLICKLFGMQQAHFSLLFTTWINFLAYELEDLTRATTKKPAQRGAAAFEQFPNTRMIIDCTEVFAQRPSGLKARQQLFSNYKHHITIKFLVGCTMNGSISYVSSAWGGRASDKKITCEECLDVLTPGEAVMADRGFLVEDEVRARGWKLHIPAFLTSNRAQLTAAEVTATRRIARARIHVERAIQRIKLFAILKLIPLSLLHVSELTNFQKPIIADIVDL